VQAGEEVDERQVRPRGVDGTHHVLGAVAEDDHEGRRAVARGAHRTLRRRAGSELIGAQSG
jgi:hypothetical protein